MTTTNLSQNRREVNRMKILLNVEELEQRIAPGGVCHDGGNGGGPQGNNGYGNGGDDGVPGNSADNNAPNADEKAADEVR
jgi:hypothetical protein